MLRNITRLLQSACMCWLHYLKSTYRWCVVLRPTLGQEQYMYFNCFNTPTTRCCQQLQPLPNVGPTIACLSGKLLRDSVRLNEHSSGVYL